MDTPLVPSNSFPRSEGSRKLYRRSRELKMNYWIFFLRVLRGGTGGFHHISPCHRQCRRKDVSCPRESTDLSCPVQRDDHPCRTKRISQEPLLEPMFDLKKDPGILSSIVEPFLRYSV